MYYYSCVFDLISSIRTVSIHIINQIYYLSVNYKMLLGMFNISACNTSNHLYIFENLHDVNI